MIRLKLSLYNEKKTIEENGVLSEHNYPVEVYRGAYLESAHKVHIAVVDHSGKLIYSYGDPNRETFARSSLKPFQAVNIFESGANEKYNFSQKDIAVCCASHSLEEIHRNQVHEILHKINLESNALKCGYHPPKKFEVLQDIIEKNVTFDGVMHNCSGKHVGMLASCQAANLDIHSYDEKNHPLQIAIKKALAEITEIDQAAITAGIDGCNLPTYRLPLDHLALGFCRLANPATVKGHYTDALETIKNSMMAYPELVAGTDKFDTDLMKVGNGTIVSKMGAEGVQGIGLPELGIGIAIKVEDGNERAASVASIQVLKELGFGDEAFYQKMANYYKPTIVNPRGNDVGKILSNFNLRKQ